MASPTVRLPDWSTMSGDVPGIALGAPALPSITATAPDVHARNQDAVPVASATVAAMVFAVFVPPERHHQRNEWV